MQIKRKKNKKVEAAWELGGSIKDLGMLNLPLPTRAMVDEEIRSLFTALVLYVQIFGEDASSEIHVFVDRHLLYVVESTADSEECPG